MYIYKRKGFTLLEVLLVIALIGILAAVVLIAINPTRQIAQARNAQRVNDIRNINQAVTQYFIDNQTNPTGITTSYQDICPVGVVVDCVDLNSVLVPDYIAGIPVDPSSSPYQIALNPENNSISVSSPTAELGVSIAINAFTPFITFAKSAGSTGVDGGTSITVLSDGGSVVTGDFSGTSTFGEGEPNETSLVSAGGLDIYVAKYNADGTLAWAKRAGGTSGDGVSGLIIKSFTDNSVMITGDFNGTAIFGSGEVNETSLVSAGVSDIFISKYNADGTLAWAKRAGGTGDDFAYGLGTFSDGTSVVTGIFRNTGTFGPGEPGAVNLVSGGASDIFIAKYAVDGTLTWARRTGGAGDHGGKAIHSYSDNTFVVSGYFTGNTTFGAGDPNQTTLNTGAGNYTIFVAKYNADGTLAWARQAGGTGYDDVRTISGYSDGSSVVTGWFNATASFGTGDPNATSLVSAGQADGYIAKYNANGTLAWAKRFGGTGWEFATGVDALSDGSVLMNGFFQGSATIGVGDPSPIIMTSAGGYDIVTAKYNADGTLAWARQVGSTSDDYGDSISSLPNGGSISTGEFRGTVTFGVGDTNETQLISVGISDMYLVKYNADGRLQ